LVVAVAVAAQPAEESALALPADIDEVVFSVRPFAPDGHYYANFGYYCFDPNQKAYSQGGGALCRLNLRTGEIATLVDDPRVHQSCYSVNIPIVRVLFTPSVPTG